MNVHIIGIGEKAMHNLAMALQNNGYQISGSYDPTNHLKNSFENSGFFPEKPGWFPERITSNLDAVILGKHLKKDNPEVNKAGELGIKVYAYPEFIFEISRTKTRVVISGNLNKAIISAMILHVMTYHSKEVDYILETPNSDFENLLNLTKANDFMVIEGDTSLISESDDQPKFQLYKPNIALLSGIDYEVDSVSENYQEQYEIFITSIVNGGILVYNEEDEKLRELVEKTEHPIRKHPYTTPEYHLENDIFILDTPEGEMPLEISGVENMSNLAGAKWICQHMGIDEDDFYEAIIDFKTAF